MNKKELLRYVREKPGLSNIRFPRKIDFNENDQEITITMQDGITKNMQEDCAAFEGWILCLKAILGEEAENFLLKWDKSKAPKDKHYQRFLYRVDKFNNLFGNDNGWFRIDDENKRYKEDLLLNEENKYYLNRPSTTGEERLNKTTENKESKIENEIIYQQDNLKDFKKCCPAKLQRQLPTGLFHTEIKKANAIFPSNHGAIDLWGKDSDDLYIIELKAKDNYKVGVLSELFFYSMMTRDEQIGIFIRKSEEGDLIKNTKNIKAFIMAPKLHPFINEKVFEVLNNKTENLSIEFGYVEYKHTEIDSEIRFDSFERKI